jgi:hypothetical protein
MNQQVLVSEPAERKPVISHLRTSQLREQDPAAVEAMLRRIEKLAYGTNDQSYWDGRPTFLEEISGLCLATMDSEVIGYSAYRRIEDGNDCALYLDSSAVIPGYRRNWLLRTLVAEPYSDFINEGRRRFFKICRTDSPVILEAMSTAPWVEEIHPSVNGDSVPDAHLRWARRVKALLWPNAAMDDDYLVMRGVYKKGSYYDKHPTASPSTQRFFNEHVRIDNGDALIVVASANYANYQLPEGEVTGAMLVAESRRLAAARRGAFENLRSDS